MIKQRPEDFIVEEIIDLDTEPGNYLYIKLTKKNWNTLDIIRKLQTTLHCRASDIGFAGIKDKKAVTTQYISLRNIKKEQIENIKIKDVSLEVLHYASKPIYKGSLKGNKFKIKCSEKPSCIPFMENYFGEQRLSKNNAEVGKAIIQKDYKKASHLIQGDLKKKQGLPFLKSLEKNILSLYIAAFQSELWNRVASFYIQKKNSDARITKSLAFTQKKIKNIEISLLAFDTEFTNEEIEELYKKEMEKEGISLKDFIFRSFPDLMGSSITRSLFVEVQDCKVEGNWISFSLPKGSYATIAIRKIETYLRDAEV